MAKLRERETERKRHHDEFRVENEAARAIVDDEARKQARLREQKKQQLVSGLDQQIEEKRQQRQENAARERVFSTLQQADLDLYRHALETERESRKIEKRQELDERKTQLREVERKKKEDQVRRRNDETQQMNSISAMLQQQVVGGGCLHFTSPPACHLALYMWL